ncbi:MAG: sensor domain-containing protein [Leptospirales bacterium]
MRNNQDGFDWRSFFEQAPDGILVIDPDSLIILETNQFFYRMMGYSGPEGIVGNPISFFSNLSEPESRQSIQNLYRSGHHSLNVQRRFRRKDGSRIHVNVSYSSIDYGGKRGILIHIRDVSREIKTETINQISLELDRMVLLGEPLDSLLSMIVKRLSESFHFLMTFFSIPNPDGTIRYVEICSSVPELPKRFLEASVPYRWDSPPGIYRASSQSLHSREPLFVKLETCQDSPLASLYEEFGLRVSLAIPILRKDKALLPWGILTVKTRYEQEIPPRFREQLIDFSEKIRLAFIRYEEQVQMRLQKAALDSSRTPFFIVTPDGKIEWANREFIRLIRHPDPENYSFSIREIFPEPLESGSVSLEEVCQTGQFYRGEFYGAAVDGTGFLTETVVSPFMDENGLVSHILVHQKDITLEKEQENKIWKLAHVDSLTNLLNRNAFIDRFKEKIRQSSETGSGLALLFIDLDGFKEINDSLGHTIGDQLLKVISNRLRKTASPEDLVGRIGGDEFVVLRPLSHDRSVFDGFLNQLLDVMSAPVHLEEHLLITTVSIGISRFPKDGIEVDLLLRKSDIAMYQAKSQGKNIWRYFEKEFEEKIQKRYEKTQSLRGALSRNEFVFFYQPQVDIEQNRVVGIESLIRWNKPGEDLPLSPAHFIPLAEETGLIVPIGEWGLETVLATIRHLIARGYPRIRVSLNFSARQFWNKEFWDTFLGKLENSREILGWFSIELTESLLMKDHRDTHKRLNLLRDMGVRISIDDFGIGYSSLSYLTQLPTDEIKVPQEFILRMRESPTDLALVKTIIQMARNLNLHLVGEGAETQNEIDILKSLGCPVVQGFGISKPLLLEELEGFLDQYSLR